MSKTIKGLEKVTKQLKKFGKDAEDDISAITEGNAQEIEADAKAFAPVDTGKLRQGIKAYQEDKLTYKIEAREKYSAYMEFGTGGKVKVPSELKEIAIQFKGKGVKEINLKPQPFLYPAFVKGRKQYLKDLKQLLKDLTNKI